VVERLPIHVHTAMLDAVVLVGGVVMIAGAVGRMVGASEKRSRGRQPFL
jgi:hypothetical protein